MPWSRRRADGVDARARLWFFATWEGGAYPDVVEPDVLGLGWRWHIVDDGELIEAKVAGIAPSQVVDLDPLDPIEGQDKISGLRSPAAIELGVHSALRMERSRGSVYPVAAGTGWFGEDHVARGVTQEAKANPDKLEAAPAPRHLFVWIDYAALAASFEMTDGSHPPPEPVAMQDYVDVAWAACGEANLEEAALWRVERGRPWTVVRPFSQ